MISQNISLEYTIDYINQTFSLKNYILNKTGCDKKTIIQYVKAFEDDGKISDIVVDTPIVTDYTIANGLSLYKTDFNLTKFSNQKIYSIYSILVLTLPEDVAQIVSGSVYCVEGVPKKAVVDLTTNVITYETITVFDEDVVNDSIEFVRVDYINDLSLKSAIAFYNDKLIEILKDNSLDETNIEERRNILVMFSDTIKYLQETGSYNTIIQHLKYLETTSMLKAKDYFINTLIRGYEGVYYRF